MVQVLGWQRSGTTGRLCMSCCHTHGLRQASREAARGIALPCLHHTRPPTPSPLLWCAEFRRGAAADVSREVAPLLKAYQEEVDRVTARCAALLLLALSGAAWPPASARQDELPSEDSPDGGAMVQAASPPPHPRPAFLSPCSQPARLVCSAKAAEGAFLGLYKRLYEAPDPAPALAAGLEAASRAAHLEAEAAKMGQVRGGSGAGGIRCCISEAGAEGWPPLLRSTLVMPSQAPPQERPSSGSSPFLHSSMELTNQDHKTVPWLNSLASAGHPLLRRSWPSSGRSRQS